MIDHEDLLKQLDYEPATGVFRWRVNKARVSVGTPAGRISNGYVVIKLNQKEHQAHRLAWFYVYKRWPESQIDHKDRVRHNNRLDNLREATNKQNHENLGLSRVNTSGVAGVRWDASRGKWFAFIRHHGRMKNLGRYASKMEAVAARRQAEKQLFTHTT